MARGRPDSKGRTGGARGRPDRRGEGTTRQLRPDRRCTTDVIVRGEMCAQFRARVDLNGQKLGPVKTVSTSSPTSSHPHTHYSTHSSHSPPPLWTAVCDWVNTTASLCIKRKPGPVQYRVNIVTNTSENVTMLSVKPQSCQPPNIHTQTNKHTQSEKISSD